MCLGDCYDVEVSESRFSSTKYLGNLVEEKPKSDICSPPNLQGISRIDKMGTEVFFIHQYTAGISRKCPRFDLPRIEFDSSVRKYTRQLKGELYYGEVQKMQGRAYKFYPNISMIEIHRTGNKKCKLFLSEDDYDKIRQDEVRSPLLTVTGRPRFRVGTERRSFDEFEVSKIIAIEDES